MSRASLDELQVRGGDESDVDTTQTSNAIRIDHSPLHSDVPEIEMAEAERAETELAETTSCYTSLALVLRSIGHNVITGSDHFIDFLSDTLEKQSLMARWLYQLFLVLDYYDAALPEEDQETWLALPVMLAAAVLSFVAKMIGRDTKDYFSAVFSSSFFYFACDLFFGEDIVRKISLSVFVLANLLCVPLIAALFYKLAAPDSSQTLVSFSTQYPIYFPALIKERLLNINAGVICAAGSVSVTLWNINRETVGRTIPIPPWEIAAFIVPGILAGAAAGNKIAEHPDIYQKFLMVAKFLKSSALIYAAISAILFMINVYQCSDRKFCASDATRLSFIFTALVGSLFFGGYNALHTEYRFQNVHEANLKLIQKGEDIADACETAFQKVGNGIVGCVEFFKSKIPACCTPHDVRRNDSENGYHVIH